MGFIKIDITFTFANAILKVSMDKNRCLMRILDIAKAIDWDSIESVLMGHYQVGTNRISWNNILVSVICMIVRKERVLPQL